MSFTGDAAASRFCFGEIGPTTVTLFRTSAYNARMNYPLLKTHLSALTVPVARRSCWTNFTHRGRSTQSGACTMRNIGAFDLKVDEIERGPCLDKLGG